VAINLVGYRITNGVQFQFTAASFVTNLPAGGYVVIAKDTNAFRQRYPAVTNLAGQFSGSLNNAGERIALVGPLYEPILDFSFDNNWYAMADGNGFSLVVVNENAPLEAWNHRANWRISGRENGSPGQADPDPIAVPTVFVNEALTHTDPPLQDAIELYNPNTTNVNIAAGS